MAAKVIAHRGVTHRRDGSAIRENTLEAFVRAMELGAEGIELDVRRSADDVLMIHHDAHISDGTIIGQTQSGDLPQWMPTLAEALEVCKDTWLNIEIKNMPSDPDYDADYGISVAVAGLIRAFDAADRVLVSSFDFASIQRIRDTDPLIPIGWLIWGQADPAQIIGRSEGMVDAIHPHEMLVDPHLMSLARDAGLIVNTWTVNDPDRVLELHKMRVNAIVTDNVPMAMDVLYGLNGD